VIRQGGLARFIPTPRDPSGAGRLAHAWDTVTAEYVPVPWGAVVLVLDIAAESAPESHWVEVLANGRVLLALSDDLGPARDSAP
jgi:hypothetical protein